MRQMVEENGNMGLSLGRLGALSDGVFAIVITLLILLIEPLPEGLSKSEIIAELLEAWHKWLAYIISFILIAFHWWRHHIVFHYLNKADKTLTWLNLLFLLWIAFIPFPTSMLITYLNTPQDEIAVIIYSFVQIMCALFLWAMWGHATRHHRLVPESLDPEVIRGLKRHFLFKIILYTVSIGVSFIHIGISLFMYAIIPVSSFLPTFQGAHEVDLSKYGK